jgi:hypothetical protein
MDHREEEEVNGSHLVPSDERLFEHGVRQNKKLRRVVRKSSDFNSDAGKIFREVFGCRYEIFGVPG